MGLHGVCGMKCDIYWFLTLDIAPKDCLKKKQDVITTQQRCSAAFRCKRLYCEQLHLKMQACIISRAAPGVWVRFE